MKTFSSEESFDDWCIKHPNEKYDKLFKVKNKKSRKGKEKITDKCDDWVFIKITEMEK